MIYCITTTAPLLFNSMLNLDWFAVLHNRPFTFANLQGAFRSIAVLSEPSKNCRNPFVSDPLNNKYYNITKTPREVFFSSDSYKHLLISSDYF